MTVIQRCSHFNAVPVDSNCETVAALSPDCGRQLPAQLWPWHPDAQWRRMVRGALRRAETPEQVARVQALCALRAGLRRAP